MFDFPHPKFTDHTVYKSVLMCLLLPVGRKAANKGAIVL